MLCGCRLILTVGLLGVEIEMDRSLVVTLVSSGLGDKCFSSLQVQGKAVGSRLFVNGNAQGRAFV